MAQYAFGIDLGGTTVKCGLFDGENLVEKWEIPTRTEENGRYILSDIAETILAKLTEKGIDKAKVKGVGIDVPGPVLANGIVSVCVNLGWGVVDVRSKLMDLLGGIEVEVGNDANVAALGEQWKGGGRGYQDMVMVTLGTGVGGGVILGGKILAGAHGAGGEIGHIKVRDDEEDVCGCGKKGCLEQYTSANGIVRVARKALAKNRKKTVLVNDETLTAKLIFDAAKEGDEVALAQVEQMGKTLGEAIAAITAVVDPEVIVIGGGVSRAGSIITDVVSKYYTPAAFQGCRSVVFKLAELGNDAGMYGAVQMVLQK